MQTSVPLSSKDRAPFFTIAAIFLLTLLGGKSWGQNTYNLCTSTSDLVAGGKYIVVSSQTTGSALALGYQNTNNRPQASVTIASGPTVSTTVATVNSDVSSPYELTLGGSSGAWTLYDAVNAGYLRANGGNSQNYLKIDATTGVWTISFSSNAAVITCTNAGTGGNNILRYNSSASLFSCYSTGQAAVYLYKYVPTVTPDITMSSSHPPLGGINQNSTNIIGSFKLDVATASATLTGIKVNTAGTYQTNDIQANGFKFWINSTNSLTGAIQLGTSQAAVSSGSIVSVAGLSQNISLGATRYILVTADLAYNAAPGRTLSLSSTAFNNFSFTSANKLGNDPVAASNAQTIASVTPSIAISQVGPSVGPLIRGSVKNSLYQLSFAVTSNATDLNSLTVTTGGTYVASDLVANSLKLYYNASNSLSGASQIGTAQAVVASGSSITFSGLSQKIDVGTTGYIWVTADISSSATGNNTIAITSTSFSNITFSAGNKTGTNPASAGGTQTIQDGTLSSDYFRSNASGNWGTAASWQSSHNGSTNWITATAAPDYNATSVVIRNGHTITVAAAVTVDQVVIQSGGTLAANSNLTVNDGTGDDIVIQNGGTISLLTNGSYPGFQGNAPTISNETGGLILVSATGVVNMIQTSNYIYKNASVLEYTLNNAFTANNVTFFPNADDVTIPVFRISGTLSSIGGTNATVVNGVLEIASSASISWSGNGNKTFRNGIRCAGTLTQNTGITNQFIISGTTAELSGAGTITLSSSAGAGLLISSANAALTSNVTVNTGPITVSGLLNVSTYTLGGSTSMTINSGGILQVGSTSSSGAINGNITATGGVTLNSGSTVEYNSSAAQYLASRTFSNLKINNSNGITLNGDVTVNGILTFTTGKITTGTNKIIIPSGGSISGAGQSTGWVSGNLQKYVATGNTSVTFEIGGTNNYRPVSVNFTGVTTAGNLLAYQTATLHPNLGFSTLNSSKSISRYFTLTNSGIAFGSYGATFNFITSDVPSTANTNNFTAGKFGDLNWTYPTVSGRTATSISISSATSLGDFALGELKATPTLTVTNSPVTYNSSAQAANVSGSVQGTVSNIKYNGSSIAPTATGTYGITADFTPADETNYNSLSGASAGNFVIQSTTATISTTVATSVTTTTASSGGNVTSDGGATVTAKGVVWGISANPTIGLSTKTIDGSGTGSFTSSITGLASGTTYYYRAYATNSGGTSYGPEYNFTTLNDPAIADFRTKASGNFSNANNWEYNTGSGYGNPTNSIPTATNNVSILHPTVLDQDFTVGANREFTISTGTLTVAPGKSLTIAGTGNFNGQPVTFRSDATGTAMLGIVSGSLTGATNVTIERYLPARRTWRILTAPLTNTGSVFANWQNNGSATGTTGAEIWAPGATSGSGLTAAGNAPSMQYFDYLSNKWVNVTDTKGTSLSGTTNQGFSIFVTGPFGSPNYITSGSAPTTLVAHGALQVGNHQALYANPAGHYILVPNPYAAPVDFAKVTRSSNIPDGFWAWDPTLGGTGSYATVSKDGSAYDIAPASSAQTQVIQNGQAVFVKSTDNTAASLTFHEADKDISKASGQVFRQAGTASKLYINLNKLVNNTPKIADGVLAKFGEGYKAEAGSDDAAKLFGNEENIAIRRSGAYLSIERRPDVVKYDTLFLNIFKMKAGPYSLEVKPDNFDITGLKATIRDKFLNTQTTVDLINGTTLTFMVTTDAASYAADRFIVVFEQQKVLAVTFTGLKAFELNGNVQVEWQMAEAPDADYYEVERSLDGRSFTVAAQLAAKHSGATESYAWLDKQAQAGTNYYRITMYTKEAAVLKSSIVQVVLAKGAPAIAAFPNPVVNRLVQLQLRNMQTGSYVISIYNTAGIQVAAKKVTLTTPNATQTLTLPKGTAAGNYQAVIKDAQGHQWYQPIAVQ